MLIASFLRELYHFSSAKTKGATSQSLSVQYFVLGVLFLFRFIFGNTSYQRVIFDSTTLATAYVGVFASLVSYYLWNEAITLIGTQKTALIYYLIPFLVEYYLLFFKSSHYYDSNC
jgi:drug/metabolite transporter (DMT)-like permease